MRKKKAIIAAAVCSVLVGMQGFSSIAAPPVNLWHSFQEKQLVLNEKSFAISESSLTLAAGEETQLEVTYGSEPIDAKSVKWRSSDSDIVSVNRNGKVTANKDGEAVITAERNGRVAICNVVVKTELKSIRLMPTELDLEEGKRASLSVICNPANISSIPPITWSSDNEEVVEVDDRGNITAKKQGTATIMVQVGEFTKTSKVTVRGEEIPVESIQLQNSKIELELEESKTVELTYYPENTTDKDKVDWKTSDRTIATVDKQGNITAVGIGTAIITAEVGEKQAKCEVIVKEKEIPLESIQLNESELELEVENKEKLEVSFYPENTTDEKKIEWTSSDETIAAVNADGEVEALKEGKATITAEVSGKQASCEVIVKEKIVELESISLEESDLSLKENEEKKLEVLYTPENTTIEKNVIWTSSNEEVAVVKDGVIKAVGIGEAVITAEVQGKQTYCDISVSKKEIKDAKLQYETFDSENGWLNSVGEGETAGTDAFHVEGIRIRLNENKLGGGIRYAVHVQNIGWQTYVSNGTQAGITNKNLRIEAIKIKLTGSIASKYDVYYRTNIEGEGWLGWAKNGEESGSTGLSKPMLAMQVILVEKGQSGPSNKAF